LWIGRKRKPFYNDARMKVTSEFKKIGHLNREQVEEWLKKRGIKESP